MQNPKKIPPTAKQVRIFWIHFAIYIITNIIIWLPHMNSKVWLYPWQAWITASWGLALVGHACALWTNYEDPGMDRYIEESTIG